jgi:hypothetical protein
MIPDLIPSKLSPRISLQEGSHEMLTVDNNFRRSYLQESGFPRLLNDATVFSLFDGGNVGVRRRQYEKLMQAPDYKPWEASF